METRLAMKARSVSPRASQADLRSSSVLRQTETMRALGRRRDVTPRLQQSPAISVDGSSLQSRSRTASPSPSNPGQLSAVRVKSLQVTSTLSPEVIISKYDISKLFVIFPQNSLPSRVLIFRFITALEMLREVVRL